MQGRLLQDTGMNTHPPIGLRALKRAIKQVGVSGLARELGIQRQQIQGWRERSRSYAVPADYCPSIERATGGAVKCEELRPDIEWGVLRGSRK